MNTISFVSELPPANNARSGGKYLPSREAADALRARPNTWAIIRSYTEEFKASGSVFASQCKSGRLRALSPSNGFEVTTRVREDKGLDIYARYVGA